MRFLLLQGEDMTRSGYWGLTIILMIIRFATNQIPDPLVDLLLSLPVNWLSLCVIAARLRDAGWSAWLVLAFIAPLPLFFLPGTGALLGPLLLATLVFTVILGIVPTQYGKEARV